MLACMRKSSFFHNQAVLFFIFSSLAALAQYLSRFLFDLSFKNLAGFVDVWPFPRQATGSFLAFLFSNIIAKVLSYVLNRKKTFKADNDVTKSMGIYLVMVILLIVIESIIGTPLQNWLYVLFGGAQSGTYLSTATALDPALYQICGTLSPMLYGIGDFLIVFFMDKYVIMKKGK